MEKSLLPKRSHAEMESTTEQLENQVRKDRHRTLMSLLFRPTQTAQKEPNRSAAEMGSPLSGPPAEPKKPALDDFFQQRLWAGEPEGPKLRRSFRPSASRGDARRQERRTVSLVKEQDGSYRIEGGSAHEVAPNLLVRMDRSDGTGQEFIGMWPHIEGLSSLDEAIRTYGNDALWLKTKGNVYRTPDVFCRKEADTAKRTFAEFAGWPRAAVRIDPDYYVSVEKYREMEGELAPGANGEAPQILVMTADAAVYLSPSKFRKWEGENFKTTMALAGLPAKLARVVPKELPPVVLGCNGKGELIAGAALKKVAHLIPDKWKCVRSHGRETLIRYPVFTSLQLIMKTTMTDEQKWFFDRNPRVRDRNYDRDGGGCSSNIYYDLESEIN